jgi:hypothetical protein
MYVVGIYVGILLFAIDVIPLYRYSVFGGQQYAPAPLSEINSIGAIVIITY